MNRARALECLVVAAACWTSGPASASAAPSGRGAIDFNRDIRPLLSGNCFKCHGPDAAARKADLRLDVREHALLPAKSGKSAIVPGAPDNSPLLMRVTSADADSRMPPPAAAGALTPDQIAKLRRWIAEGAHYAPHWSYVKPKRPAVPVVRNATWPSNPIDNFILEKLESHGMAASPPADRATLIRRAALDLTGLPPDPNEVEVFLADGAPDAYAKVIDRLLAKPTFGEHWARLWLDLARYADSAGYADDPPRTIWRFRDYVVRCLNANKPFDRFTLEQIAGDLLDNPDEDTRAATAFHRNTMTNSEGGTEDEEFRNAAVVDRVNTTMAVWMGTSMACAQCHDHKYDPFSQREYFRLFAVFNNTEDADKQDESPVMRFFTGDQKERRASLAADIAAAEQRLQPPPAGTKESLERWDAGFPLQILWQRSRKTSLQPVLESERAAQYANIPDTVLQILLQAPAQRSGADQQTLLSYYAANLAPETEPTRRELARWRSDLERIQPYTVPVMQELPAGKQRVTRIHLRGNYQNLGDEVTPGVPDIFPPLAPNAAPRLALARWLVSPDNPLTARVLANRLWEQVFGNGLVRTPEEFGAQGDLPTHPELLDWLATELLALNWDIKAFLKLLVTSAAYQQTSRVTPDLLERDPENTLLSRGPRHRMPAEMVRDQALYLSGLLSGKMYGPSVRPPQPSLGLSAAFGGSLDWKNSEGEDRYRRAVYVEWRRTSPYPSMVTFDAPTREVCTLRRPRSNTPLQALVTLNDPVYVEAAQAFARQLAAREGGVDQKCEFGLRRCLVRAPAREEVKRLALLYERACAELAGDEPKAKQLATEPLGAAPDGMDVVSLAAWTVVANVLLNLDEVLMRP